MSFSTDLLAQARHLATREPKRPKQASLRRALSAAYYALFHLLSADAAALFAPKPLRSKVKRVLQHGAMKNVCEQIAHGRLSGPLSRSLTDPVEADLRAVATTFVEMQQLRHQADYDMDYLPIRTDVLQKILMTEQAFAKWASVRQNPNSIIFLASLLFHDRWRS
jgi:uncharacterized protein (UPF0332 family)